MLIEAMSTVGLGQPISWYEWHPIIEDELCSCHCEYPGKYYTLRHVPNKRMVEWKITSVTTVIQHVHIGIGYNLLFIPPLINILLLKYILAM